MVLIEKEKIKKKMVEFIIDSYWTKTTAQFKDVKNKFCAPPISLSEGSISNYLDELVAERKIQKWREGNNVYYCPPQISSATKFSITTIGLSSSILILVFYALHMFTYTSDILNFLHQYQLYAIFSVIFFDVGVVLTCVFWHRSSKSLNTKTKHN